MSLSEYGDRAHVGTSLKAPRYASSASLSADRVEVGGFVLYDFNRQTGLLRIDSSRVEFSKGQSYDGTFDVAIEIPHSTLRLIVGVKTIDEAVVESDIFLPPSGLRETILKILRLK